MSDEGFVVLYADVPEQRRLWLEAWERWPDREVMAHPAYVELFARPVDRAACAVAARGSVEVLYPFVLRPLAAEPWADGDPSFDLTSPYGYGGAFIWGGAPSEIAGAFWRSLAAWACEASVVSGFSRLSLFPDQILPPDGVVRRHSTNIVRDLNIDDTALWRSYAHKVRKNVNRARASGLRVEVDTEGEFLDEFRAIYNETMERRKAGAFYQFDRTFFERIATGLCGQVAWVFARKGAEPVSAELILVSAGRTYSFLGGTRAVAFPMRPNDLLKHEIIRWSRAEGKTAYVLGGGYRDDDGILAYKSSFAPGGERVFSVAQQVFDPDAVERLCRRRASSSPGEPWRPDPDWFPPYRG